MEKLFISSEELINMIEDWWNDNTSKEKINEALYKYLKNSDFYREAEKNNVFTSIIKIIFSKQEVKDFYYIMSALFRITMIPDVLYEIIRFCISDTSLSKEKKRFIYGQCASYLFLYPTINNSQARDLLDDLYETIYYDYSNNLSDLFLWIPVEKRTKDLVIVFTSQFLSMNHGPTKTVLDRCYTLSKNMNKKVFIINTADTLTPYGIIDWFDTQIGNYIPELDSEGSLSLSYLDESFPYFQCPQRMPDVSIIRDIMKTIIDEKPYFIVSIGDSNITADLCSKIVPVLSVTLGPSERAKTRSTFQMTGHKIDSEDLLWLKKHNLQKNHIIEGLFTSSFKPQTHTFSRKELGLDDDWFICIVVGARLYTEVTDEFLNVVSKLAQNKVYCVFMGNFFNYDQVISDNQLLKNYTRNLGFQEDAMAIYDCCNAYLNPNRSGGGTSAAEALYKGLPVVTLNYGDVATGVGEDFWVNSYDDMVIQVLKLATNKEYYQIMNKKAKERAARLTDTESEFKRVIKEMESRPEFY